MNCPRMFEAVDAAHLAVCLDCQHASQVLSESAVTFPARLESLKAPALADLRRTGKATPWWVWALMTLAVNGVVATAASLLVSHSVLQHSSISMHWLSTAGWVLVGLAGAVVAVIPGGRRLRGGVIAAAGLAGLLTVAAASDLPFHAPGIACALMDLAMAALPLAAALWAMTTCAYEPSRALVAGLAAASSGMVAVHLHCPNGTLVHLLIFHLLPVAAAALIAVAIRSRLPTHGHAP